MEQNNITWADVGEILADKSPLLSELLMDSGARSLGALLSNHLSLPNDPEVVFSTLFSNSEAIEKCKVFEKEHSVKFKMMLLAKMEVGIEKNFTNKSDDELKNIYIKLHKLSLLTVASVCWNIGTVAAAAAFVFYLM